MNIIPRITLLALLLLCAACSTTYQPQSESISKAIDLGKLETFSVIVYGVPEDTAFGQDVRSRAFETLVREFDSRGYDYRSSTPYDFNLMFTTRVMDRDDLFITHYGANPPRVLVTEDARDHATRVYPTRQRDVEYSPNYESDPIKVTKLQRLFVIDIVDAETNVLLWRGYMATDDIDLGSQAAIDNYIETILKEMPES